LIKIFEYPFYRNEFYFIIIFILSSFFIQDIKYNQDGYETIWHVEQTNEFAADYYLGLNLYLFDDGLAINEHIGKNVYEYINLYLYNPIKPDYTSIDLCIHIE
jgi:hypothetical protein